MTSGSRRILGLLLFSAAAAAADGPPQIRLWPGSAPDEKGEIAESRNTLTPSTNQVAGRPFMQLGNVADPSLAVYRPSPAKDSGAAVLVFPGGSYQILAIDMEGTEVCEWLNSIGITGVLVRYRVPARADRPRYAAALQDGQRAVSLTRHHAGEWRLDPKRIGVLGFSAGGHLAAATSTNFENRTYAPLDDADRDSSRPDFAILIYPAYLAARNTAGTLSAELTVTPNTPPSFLVQTEDDPVRVENSLFYYKALKDAKVPAEMHLFSNGGHGYGLRATGSSVSTWPQSAERWLRSIGVLRQ